MTEVRITIAGHTNHGKTSIVRTLTNDVTFGQVANRPITVDVSAQNITGAALPGALRIFDTPGLERASDALASLSGNPTFDGVVKYFKTGESDAGDLATLEQIQNHTDVVLYVVRLNQLITQDYKDEFHILRISGVPLIPIFNFVRGKDSHKDAWVAYLKTEGCHEYTDYDAHAWEPDDEEDLWTRVKAKLHNRDQQRLVEAWRDTRLRKAELKDNEAAKIIAELLQKVAGSHIKKRMEPTDDRESITNQANQEFKVKVVALEHQKLISILDAYQLNVGPISRAIANGATSSDDTAAEKTIPDLFGRTVEKDFGIGFLSGAAGGAVIGGGIGAFVGGASFMTGMIIGTVVGGVLGAGRSLTQSQPDQKQSTLTISSSAELLEAILGRALTLTRDLRRRGFANQSAPDLNSAKKHVPSAAKPFLKVLLAPPKRGYMMADPSEATKKLEAEILQWIEQTS